MMTIEDHRQIMIGYVMMQYETDGTTTNYMGW